MSAVEAVARAMYALDGTVTGWDRESLLMRNEYRAAARAALAAIRTPTSRMVEEMQRAATWTEAFEAAIDAAMEETRG